jgi:hypothetical protein
MGTGEGMSGKGVAGSKAGEERVEDRCGSGVRAPVVVERNAEQQVHDSQSEPSLLSSAVDGQHAVPAPTRASWGGSAPREEHGGKTKSREKVIANSAAPRR